MQKPSPPVARQAGKQAGRRHQSAADFRGTFGRSAVGSVAPSGQWTFLSNHSHVLILLSHFPMIFVREIAVHVGITERAVQRIIADLEAGHFISRVKVGRRNRYTVRRERWLRHPLESHRTIGDLIALVD